MNDLNTFSVTGTLSRKGELKTSKGGTQYIDFDVLTVKEWQGVRKEAALRMVVFGEKATAMAMATVGSSIFVNGSLKIDERTGQDGKTWANLALSPNMVWVMDSASNALPPGLANDEVNV